MAFLRLYPIILAWDRSRDPELHRTCWTTRGHLHDGVILLVRPECFSFFLSYLNFGNPGEVWITKALICTRKQNPEGFCNLVILVKWCHRANSLLNLSLMKADTHDYTRGVLLPEHAPGSFCTCQYTRGSVFKFAQFAPGAFSQIFNRLNIVEHFAGWKFCSWGWSVPMKSLVHTEKLCSRSVPLEHVLGAKSPVCIGLKSAALV